MDVAMPIMGGLEATRRIKAELPQVKVLMLTMHENENYFFKSLQAGAQGFIVKGAMPNELLLAVRTVAQGEIYLYSALNTKLLCEYMSQKHSNNGDKAAKALTGREIKLKLPEKLLIKNGKAEMDSADEQLSAGTGAVSQGWGLDYRYQESYFEKEQVSFSAQGVFKTADGKEVQFGLDLNLSRSFIEQTHLIVKAGDALIDPLIINYNGLAAEITDTKFSFDLDADGNEEMISTVEQGSGFLALDQNGDGIINNGSELFGAVTGNGFAELGSYDEDGNGWIDEADSVFDNLRIWSKNSAGGNELVALAQKGIGAIYLGNAAAQFSYKGDDNQLNGLNRKAGIFAREDGTVGTIQQVDFVV
jgi:CheY-like chemotaxis protein